MNLNDIAAEHAPAMLERFGEPVTWHQSGQSGLGKSITAIVPRSNVVRDIDRGVGFLERYEISFAVGSLTLRESDTWVIGTRQYTTEVIHDPSGGMQKVTIVRRMSQGTTTTARSRSHR